MSERSRGIRSCVAICALAIAAAASAEEPPRPRFSRAEYVEIVRRYARGERAAAVAALGEWSERDLARQLAPADEAAKAAERCPSCPNSVNALPLKAAVMLHWDRDRADQPAPEGVEQPRRCPGALAVLAGRYARVIARSAPLDEFPRRFLHMVVLSCQWDGCFEEADRWAGDAIAIYPRDADLLVARGSVREEAATIGQFPQGDALQGDAEVARLALRQGMRGAGHRAARDPYWDYLVVNAAELRDRREDLYREALE